MTSLAFDFAEAAQLWRHVPVEYPPARELADRHYSRQTVGADGILPPGERFLFWHESEHGKAVWGVCRNRFRGLWRWRNTIFRNEGDLLSSTLIIAATDVTYECWLRRYKALPPERLTTEIDVEATRRRRGKYNLPGHCFLKAGWTWIDEIDPGHGRPRRAIIGAPWHPLQIDPAIGLPQ